MHLSLVSWLQHSRLPPTYTSFSCAVMNKNVPVASYIITVFPVPATQVVLSGRHTRIERHTYDSRGTTGSSAVYHAPSLEMRLCSIAIEQYLCGVSRRSLFDTVGSQGWRAT